MRGFKPFFRLCVLFSQFLLLSLYGCRQNESKIHDHPDFFDKIIKKANSVYSQDPEKSLLFLDSVYNGFHDPGPGDLCQKYFFKHFYFENYKKDYPKAHQCLDSAMKILDNDYNKEKYYNIIAQVLFHRGDLYLAQYNYRGAFKSYYEGRNILKKFKDSCLLFEYSNRLARVSYLQENYESAILYYKKNLLEFDICEKEITEIKFENTQGVLDNLGLSYFKLGKPDTAINYYHLALDYINKYENKFQDKKSFMVLAKGVIYGNLGTALIKTGNDSEGEKNLIKSIAINSKAGYDQHDAQETRTKLIDFYISNLRLPEALLEISKLKKSLDSLPDKGIEAKWNKLSSDYFQKKGLYDKAFAYLQTYLEMNDSIENLTKKLAGTEIYYTLENMDRSDKFEDLTKKIGIQTIFLICLMVFAVISLLILLMAFGNSRRSKKYIANLKILNEKINHHNKELEQTLNSLEKSQKDNSRILNVVAHDLKNPIAAISGLADIMALEDNLNEEQSEILNLIKLSCTNSMEMIADLLVVNTTEEQFKLNPVELFQLLRRCVALYQVRISEKKQKIELTGEEVTIMANQEKIWRVISNLLVNAIKFSPDGSLIKVKLKQQEASVLLSVEDNGIGIPDHLKNKIFSMFSGAGRTGTSGETSIGMGLGITKQIVEAHNGKIWFESEVNKGTTFFVEFPLNNVKNI